MIGDRLLLARKKAGLSLRALADRMDHVVSAQAIGKYERGEMIPRSDVLVSMSKVLNEPVSFFLSPSELNLQGIEFRKKAATRKKDIAAVEAAVLDHIDRYLQIEEILDLKDADWEALNDPKFRISNIEDAEAAADRLREIWEIGFDPILNITELFEERGIKVLMLGIPVDALTCLVKRAGKKPVLVIACKHIDSQNTSIERQRFSLVHEFGHQILNIGEGLNKEKACNRFAGAFLAPRKTLFKEVGKLRHSFGYDELVEIKKMYGISAWALVYRFKDLGIIDEQTMRKIYSGIGRTWRKAEPERLTKKECDEEPKRFSRLCYRAIAEGLITLSKASELLRMSQDVISERVWGEAASNEGIG